MLESYCAPVREKNRLSRYEVIYEYLRLVERPLTAACAVHGIWGRVISSMIVIRDSNNPSTLQDFAIRRQRRPAQKFRNSGDSRNSCQPRSVQKSIALDAVELNRAYCNTSSLLVRAPPAFRLPGPSLSRGETPTVLAIDGRSQNTGMAAPPVPVACHPKPPAESVADRHRCPHCSRAHMIIRSGLKQIRLIPGQPLQ
jgi:hypothetical protein